MVSGPALIGITFAYSGRSASGANARSAGLQGWPRDHDYADVRSLFTESNDGSSLRPMGWKMESAPLVKLCKAQAFGRTPSGIPEKNPRILAEKARLLDSDEVVEVAI